MQRNTYFISFYYSIMCVVRHKLEKKVFNEIPVHCVCESGSGKQTFLETVFFKSL